MSVVYAEASQSSRSLTPIAPLPAKDKTGAEADLLYDRIFTRIWGSLALAGAADSDFNSVPNLIGAYNESLQQLRNVREEAIRFLEAVCDAHVRAIDEGAERPDQLEAAARKQARRLAKRYSLPPVQVSPYLDAELVAEPVCEAFASLQPSLQISVMKIVKTFVAVLQQLVDDNIIGTIEFPVEAACRFRYYQTEIYERSIDVSVSTSLRGNKERTTTTQRGKVDYVLAEKTHHLAYATRHQLTEYPDFVPLRVQSMLREIPSWVRPEIEIVDGDLFREERRESVERTEEWAEETWTEKKRPKPRKKKRPRRRNQTSRAAYSFDPAATLGTYVLAAWLPDEAEKELHQRHQRDQEHRLRLQTQREEYQGRLRPLVRKIAVLQLLTIAAHSLASGLGPGAHIVAFVVSLALLYRVPDALKLHALAEGIVADAVYFAQSAIAVGCLALAINAGALYVLYGTFLALVATLVFLAATIVFAAAWAREYVDVYPD